MELVQQYKTHVLCILEGSVGAIDHASPTHLLKLDKIQKKFLDGIGLGAIVAFIQHHLAPLQLRRDIAMLGFLHKVVLRDAHPDILALFPMAPPNATRYNLCSSNTHTKQLCDQVHASDLMVLRRSVFGLIQVYNRLEQDIVDCKTVTAFQSNLTHEARSRAQSGSMHWPFPCAYAAKDIQRES